MLFPTKNGNPKLVSKMVTSHIHIYTLAGASLIIFHAPIYTNSCLCYEVSLQKKKPQAQRAPANIGNSGT